MATTTEIQERLGLYREAEKKILEGNQSWEVAGNKFTQADLQDVQRMITSLESQLAQAERGGAFAVRPATFRGRR